MKIRDIGELLGSTGKRAWALYRSLHGGGELSLSNSKLFSVQLGAVVALCMSKIVAYNCDFHGELIIGHSITESPIPVPQVTGKEEHELPVTCKPYR